MHGSSVREPGHQRHDVVSRTRSSRSGLPRVVVIVRVVEPAADLAVAAALLSAREDTPLPADTVVFGEISLSGALRPVGQTENRLKEAQKLGFNQAIAPSRGKAACPPGMVLHEMTDLAAVVGQMFGAG